MRISKPSPAMVVASIALFVALGGTSVAAVSFARNAGAVDGKSAVASSASSKRAAGKLVATANRGDRKGQLPGRFVADVPHAKPFLFAPAAADNGAPAVRKLGSIPAIGSLAVSCSDGDLNPGAIAPVANVTLTVAAAPVNALIESERSARAESRLNQPEILLALPGTSVSRNLLREGRFELDAVSATGDQRINVTGATRRDAEGQCVVYGTVTELGD